MTMRLWAATMGFGALALGGGLVASGASRVGIHRGYAPEQGYDFLRATIASSPCHRKRSQANRLSILTILRRRHPVNGPTMFAVSRLCSSRP